jgi:hypothetical protein
MCNTVFHFEKWDGAAREDDFMMCNTAFTIRNAQSA